MSRRTWTWSGRASSRDGSPHETTRSGLRPSRAPVTRRVLLAIVALSAILLALFATATRTAPASESLVFSYSSTDAGRGGVLALRRWLSALGYETKSVQAQRFAVPADVEVLFVLGPTELVPREDARLLREWVARGNTLVIGSDRSLFDETLYEAFGATLEDRSQRPISGEISPALSRPILRDLSTTTGRALSLREPAAVVVGDGARAILAERRIGAGRAWLLSAPDMLVNANLGAAQNDRLVLNLLADARRGAVVGFDEYHHGVHLEPDAFGLFTGTAPGRAALVAGALAFLYVALRGRRLGSPLPLEERPARSSLEYVRSFAGLLRRSHAAPLAAQRLARRYRRRLARSLGLRPTSDAGEVVSALERVDPQRARDAAELFRRLDAPLAENDVLAAVARAESLLEEVDRR